MIGICLSSVCAVPAGAPTWEPIITPSKIPHGEFSQCHFEQGITQRNASREPFLLRQSTSTQRFLALSACQIFGDETSIASAEAMIRALPAEAVVLACLEVASTDHRWPQAEVTRSESICWVDRAGRPGSALVSWLERQSLPSANYMTAYVTGEAWLCAIVQAHLVRDRGFPVRAVRAMPYWKTRSR